MSPRAAWQLQRLGFADVYDFVVGKAHWLASGRPTVRAELVVRVGSRVSWATTAFSHDSVAAVRRPTSRVVGDDVVVVDQRRVVVGRVRRSDLDAADTTELVGDIMRLGPTTIRPDELVVDVTERMVRRGVGSVLVTCPTGELIGQFVPGEGDLDE